MKVSFGKNNLWKLLFVLLDVFEVAAMSAHLENLANVVAVIPNVIDWYTYQLSDSLLLSIKGVKIDAETVIKTMNDHGFRLQQVYVE